MKSAQRAALIQGGLLALALLGLGYIAWQRYHPPARPTYEGKTLDQWIADLSDPDYSVSDRAADVLVDVGVQAVPVLVEACGQDDIRLHRRAAAVLVRIGAPAAKGLVEALRNKPLGQRIEVVLVRLGPAAVPAMRETLADDKKTEAAAHVLGLIGPRATDAVPDLIVLLERQQAPTGLRSQAAFALGRIGEPVGDIVKSLSAALKDDKMEVRQQAAEALSWIGPPARPAVPALIAALKDDESKVVRKACQALSFIGDGSAVPALLATFQGDRAEVVAEAGRALWRLGPKAEQVVPALLPMAQGPIDKSAHPRALLASFGPRAVLVLEKALRDEKAERREAAAEVLGRIGPPARTAVPALIAALKDKSSTVALTAAMALAQIDATRAVPAVPLLADSLDVPGAAVALANIGPDARAAVPALIAALKPRKDVANQDAFRAGAPLALARIGTPAVSDLIEALKDKREGVAPLAGGALGWILPPPKKAVPALREALKNDRANAAIYAHALGQLGSLARPAVPDLTDLLTDSAVRSVVALAMVGIDADQASKVVALLLKDAQATDEKQRQAAILALARLGPAAAPAVPSLAGLLKDPNVAFRRLSLFLLGEIGHASRSALPALIAALSDSDNEVRASAAHLLEEIGPEASEAVRALIANLRVPQMEVRARAASALGHIGPGAKDALRPLLECLLDPDANVRYAATLSLGRIDPHFTAGVPGLQDALHDSSPDVRLAAIDSLSHIDRDAALKDGVPVLLALSNKPEDLSVRFRAIDGLSQLAPEEAKNSAMPWLLIELTDANPDGVNYAARLLAQMEPSLSQQLILALAGQLPTPFADKRPAILHTLGEFGAKAREVVPDIERLLYDGTPGVRPEAIRSLRAIHPARLKQLGVG
jgi:HEAT repeat protein